jgi:hypothetical protein
MPSSLAYAICSASTHRSPSISRNQPKSRFESAMVRDANTDPPFARVPHEHPALASKPRPGWAWSLRPLP